MARKINLRNRYSLLALMVLLALFSASERTAKAQTSVALTPAPRQVFFGPGGVPDAGGCLFTYASNSSSPLATYIDGGGVYQNQNPITLDPNGSASIYLSNASYRFVLTEPPPTAGTCATSPGAQIYLQDDVSAFLVLAGAPVFLQQLATDPTPPTLGELYYNTTQNCFRGYVGTWGCFPLVDALNTWTFTQSFAGGLTASGGISGTPNINGVLYVDGTSYSSLQNAFAACPVTSGVGCVIDMRGNSSALALNLGTLDPGTIELTVLLGPYSYTLTSLTLRSGLHFEGAGEQATTITQGVSTTIPIQSPPSGQTAPANIVTGADIGGFSLEGAASSSVGAISVVDYPSSVASGSKGGGLWYSRFHDMNIGGITPFGGEDIRLDTTQCNTVQCDNQWLTFDDVTAVRANNGLPALHITGAYNGQMHFQGHIQFDGPYGGDSSPGHVNIQVDDGGGSGLSFCPYSIQFDNLTSQWASGAGASAILLEGVIGLQVNTGHFEGDNGVVKAQFGNHCSNTGVVFNGAAMMNGTAIDSGNGFITSTDAQSAIAFINYSFFGTPDAISIGASTKYVTMFGGQNSNNISFPPLFAQIPFLTVKDQGTCTMIAGLCPTQTLSHTYAQTNPVCIVTWTGTGTLTGLLKCPTSQTSAAPQSSVLTDTAQVNWVVLGY